MNIVCFVFPALSGCFFSKIRTIFSVCYCYLVTMIDMEEAQVSQQNIVIKDKQSLSYSHGVALDIFSTHPGCGILRLRYFKSHRLVTLTVMDDLHCALCLLRYEKCL